MRKTKTGMPVDRLLTTDSPILDCLDEGLSFDQSEGLAVAGKLNIGKKGNPVTILIEDEETGETLEVSHVSSALLVIEDSRRSSSGWLSVAIGSVEKLSSVLQFLSKITLEGLERLAKR